jgi:acetoin utilization protein AcuB
VFVLIVREWYNREKPFLAGDMHPKDVKKFFLNEDVNALPVIDDDGQYLGILHYEDFKDAEKTEKAIDYSSNSEFYVEENDTLEDVTLLLMENHEMVVPVLDSNRKLLGCISIFEILEAFARIAAFDESGMSISLLLEDSPGKLKALVDLLAFYNINILSILTYKRENENGKAYRELYLKIDSKNISEVRDILEKVHIPVNYLRKREAY